MNTMNWTLLNRAWRAVLVTIFVTALAACSSSDGTAGGSNSGISLGNSGSANDPVSPDFGIAYVKRTLPDPNDPNAITLQDDLRVQRVWNGPADVYVRQSASPSASEMNITASITNGMWDVRDLDVSFDGTKLIFSMRPPLLKNTKADEQPVWSIYEYDTATSTLRQVIADPIAASLGHDVGPHYLPDGRIVFSSTRQHDAKAVLIDQGEEQFTAGIEGNRNTPAFVLHVMNADGSNIKQISFNTGHDLDPSVLNDGRILFTRWDINSNAGMHLYAIDPDGGNLQLLYGRNSHNTGTPGSVVQFTKARSRPDGKVIATLIPFAGTQFGGDPVLIDTTNFVEDVQTVLGAKVTAGATAQSPVVVNDVVTTPAPANSMAPPPPSPGGRFSSVFPLWDGTNRMLVSWTECRLLDQTLVVPCTDANLAKKGVLPAPTIYSIWIYDPRNNTQLPIVVPATGFMYTEAVALEPRNPVPTPIPDAKPSTTGTYSFTLAAEGVGILNIKSVYDFDGVDTAPGGIASVRDPTKRAANPNRPRFLRIEKAVSLPDKEILSNNDFPGYAFGAAGNFMREMIGYAPIEPDGSVRVAVPTDIPFQITILDANGRRLNGSFPLHRSWLQVRTGEIVTCNGCHVQTQNANGTPSNSHGRAGLFSLVNTGAPVSGQAFPNTALTVTDRMGNVVPAARAPLAGETMAEYRAAMQVTCVDAACAAVPAVDLLFADVWTPMGIGTPDPPISWQNQLLGTPPPVNQSCETNWQGNCRVVIHYPTHIAPLWVTPRASITAVDPNTTVPYTTCTGCHAPVTTANVAQVAAGQLDLTSSPAATNPCVQEEFTSFCELLFPHQKLDPVTMLPVFVPGPINPATGLPTMVPVMVVPPMSGGGANASAAFFNEFATGGTHAGWLNGSELLLLSEWLDLGGQYYNNPFAIPPPA
jgi:Hydrazine synthase alpha subunit middle domain/WD40-like Beta Propeller Repeat